MPLPSSPTPPYGASLVNPTTLTLLNSISNISKMQLQFHPAAWLAWHDHAHQSLCHVLQHPQGQHNWSQSQHNLPHPCQQKRAWPRRMATPQSKENFPSNDDHQNRLKKPPLPCHQANTLGWHPWHHLRPKVLSCPCNFQLAVLHVQMNFPPRNCRQQTQHHAHMGPQHAICHVGWEVPWMPTIHDEWQQPFHWVPTNK